ncbi:lipopolysaccharide heptosyltransferase II [candidate division KSB1 bacterium]
MNLNTVNINKILIIRLSSIGDIILTTPLVRSLREKFDDAVIDYVVKEEYLDLVRTNHHLNDVIPFNKSGGFTELIKLKRYIRSQKYDLVIDLHKNFRSVYLRSFLSGAKITKYKKNYFNRSLLVWFGINRFEKIIPVYRKYFYAVKDLGLDYDESGTEVHIPEKEEKKVKNALNRSGYDWKRPLIIICPGAGFATKRWKKEGYTEAAETLAREYDAFIGLLGGSGDKELCESIRTGMKKRAVNFAGSLSLLESAALLRESSLVITNDTGMLHLAQSQVRPVVAVYGPTTIELGYFPFMENSFVIQYDIACRPCTHNGSEKCPRKHFKCMNEIRTEEVIKASEQLIESEKISSGKNDDGNLVSSV